MGSGIDHFLLVSLQWIDSCLPVRGLTVSSDYVYVVEEKRFSSTGPLEGLANFRGLDVASHYVASVFESDPCSKPSSWSEANLCLLT